MPGVQPSNLPAWWVPDLQVASPEVKVFALQTRLAQFIVRAARIHVTLFGIPLVVTSGNDGHHATHSAHFLNAAVDLRSHDKSDADQLLFGLILVTLSEHGQLGVFDERFTTSPHWHVEDAKLLGG
jgi:hypothetical protein